MKNFILSIGTNSTTVNGGGDVSGAFTFTDFLTIALWLVVGLLALAVICFIVSFLMVAIVSVLSRLSFVSKLRKWTKGNGYIYERCNSSLKSLFFSYSGADILLISEEKSFNLKFFPYLLKFRKVLIGTDNKVLLSGYKKRRLDLSFERDIGENIIILAPSAHTMHFADKNGYVIVDNGVVYKNGAAFYDADGFFRSVDNIFQKEKI